MNSSTNIMMINDTELHGEKMMSNHENLKRSAAIVLGGGMDPVERKGQTVYEPSDQVKLRLDKAYEFFKSKAVNYIVLTGKYSKRVGIAPNIIGPKTEAEVGKRYLEEKLGMDEDYLLYENQSFDTIGNAWFAKRICLEPFNITVCRIITSDYHIKRSKMIFEWVLGPQYTVEPVSLKSTLTIEEREQRDKIERIFINYMKTNLLGSIPPGDNEAIGKFIKDEHLRYCLSSERSKALFEVYIQTAAIKAGY